MDKTLNTKESRQLSTREIRFRAKAQNYLSIFIFLLPSLVILIVFAFFPIIKAINNSFYDFSLLNPARRLFLGIGNYSRMILDVSFWEAVLRTLLYSAAKAILQLPLALGLALFVNRKMRGISIVRSSIIAPVACSVTVIAVIWNLMYHPDVGLFNAILTAFGFAKQPFLISVSQALPSIIIMSVWQDVGYTMVILLAGLQGIPNEYYEAAAIDGANDWSIFLHITAPLLKRFIVFAVITITVSSFQVFTPVYVMTKGGPQDSTLVAVYYIYKTAFTFQEMGYASTLTVVLTLVLIVIALLESRLLRSEVEY
jgi:ABC-type sugar transport system permease subunit